MSNIEQSLAKRLGMTVHVSPLRRRLDVLRSQFPSYGTLNLEDWLVDVANARGARIVVGHQNPLFTPPPVEQLSNEELVVALCQLQCLDRPQMLRLAAQIISRRIVDINRLIRIADMERAEVVLGELARQALRVDPNHDYWKELAIRFKKPETLREPILHWTRLAEPIMSERGCNAASWRLVA